MKTLKVLLSLSFFIFQFSISYGQTWLWGAGGYGPVDGNGGVSPVATDKNGNAYVTAISQTDSLVLDNYVLHNTRLQPYFVKYNSSGKVIWARIGGGYSIATDESENVYVTGRFRDTLTIGPSVLISQFGDVYVAKFDSSGNPLWAKQSLATSRISTSIPISLATDNSNNVFLTGYFGDTLSFGNFMLNTHYNGSKYHCTDVFLVKYDPNGNALWAQQSEIPSAASTGSPDAVATDNFGNAYIAGGLFDTISFGSFTITGTSSFLVKYSPIGTVLWAKQNTGGPCGANSVITDGTNSYVTGVFEDTVKFGSHALYASSKITTFLTKYDANGNAIWAKQSSENWEGTGVASDMYGHVYITGYDFEAQNPDSFKFNGYTLYSDPSSIDASYILKMDTAGNVLCGSMLNNLNVETKAGLASDYTGTYVYTASIFWNGSVTCGPDVLTATGVAPNGFVGRWLPCDVNLGVGSITPQTANILLYPNPNNGQFTIQSSGASGQLSVEVYNVLGEKVLAETLRDVQGNNSINISNQPNGIYLYRVITENGNVIGSGKVIIAK